MRAFSIAEFQKTHKLPEVRHRCTQTHRGHAHRFNSVIQTSSPCAALIAPTDVFTPFALWFQDEEFLQRKDKAVRAIVTVQVSSCRSVRSHWSVGVQVMKFSCFPGSLQTSEEVQEAEGGGGAAG